MGRCIYNMRNDISSYFKLCVLLIMSGILGCAMAEAKPSKKTTYGYVEKVTLVANNLTLSAKLDTGAKSASLSAINIEEKEEHGIHYLHFLIPTKTGPVPFKAAYKGKIKIKPRVGEKLFSIRRPVVLVMLRIGNEEREVLVNLTNRKRFNYPLLLGRDAIVAFHGTVDPAKAFYVKSSTIPPV